MALAFQDDSSMWIIIAAVLVILVFIVVIIGVGLTIFFVMRKRSKAQKVPAASAVGISGGPSFSPIAGMSSSEPAQVGAPLETPPPAIESFSALPDTTPLEAAAEAAASDAPSDFDPQRTVAISREPTVAISYGTIKFVSGVLAGEQFDVKPEGSYIGRESTLSQIVVSDPRISKRHLWIGVRDGLVRIIDQDSRNGTFVNDPKSDRVTEATLNPGDTVIMGESDVARFEYQM